MGVTEGQSGPGTPLDIVGVGAHPKAGAGGRGCGRGWRGGQLGGGVLGGFEHVPADGVVGVHEIAGLAALCLAAERHQSRGRAAAAEGTTFTIQVVIGAPPAGDVGAAAPLGLPSLGPLLALGPPALAVLQDAFLAAIATDLACRALQGGRLGEEEPLDRMDQVADAARTLAPGLGLPAGELERAKAIAMDGQLLLKLVQQVGRQPVDLGGLGMAGEGTLLWHLEVGVVVDSGEGAARRWQLVVEWEEPVPWQGILPREAGLAGKGLCGRKQVGVAVRAGKQGLVWWVQAVGEVAGAAVTEAFHDPGPQGRGRRPSGAPGLPLPGSS